MIRDILKETPQTSLPRAYCINPIPKHSSRPSPTTLLATMPRSAPSSAAELLPEIRAANNSLIQAFEAHPQFAPQHSRRQGKIYFMWDFAKRTSAMFDSILQDLPPPDTPATRGSIPNVPPSSMSQRQKKELRDDAVGRCVM